MTAAEPSYILTITCPDTVGIVAAVSGYLPRQGFLCGRRSAHFGDRDTGMFFSRTRFSTNGGEWSEQDFADGFAEISATFDMRWEVHDTLTPMRAVIMVSKHDHCLNDLLYRIPYRFTAHGNRCDRVEPRRSARIIGVARYQVLPYPGHPEDQTAGRNSSCWISCARQAPNWLSWRATCRCCQTSSGDTMQGQIINIHHSFLPGFKGARPYYNAHERGVKLIGATAHYGDLRSGRRPNHRAGGRTC